MAHGRGSHLLVGILPAVTSVALLACGGDSPLDIAPTSTIAVTAVSTQPAQVAGNTPSDSSATPTPEPGAEQEYVVQAGDTLSGIAAQFGVTVDAIVQANSIADPNVIAPGETLIIPAAQ